MTAKFTLPILYVTALLDGFSDQYETLPVSLEYRIIETDVSTGKEINTYSGLILSNSDLSNIGGAKNKEWLPEDGKESGVYNTPQPLHYRRYTDTTASNPVYETIAFNVQTGRNYKLTCKLGTVLGGTVPTNTLKYTGSDIAESLSYG